MEPLIAPHLPALAWLLVSAGLVFFMQAGFCAVESGMVRYKNSINVALKNVVDFCTSFVAFLVLGYSLMFSPSADPIGLIGTPVLFLSDLSLLNTAGTDVFTIFPFAFFFFQATFCNTAATIVSGGVAERCRFMAYVLVSLGIGLVIYPIFGHWAWGGGWLARLGYHDFAGSSVVHLLGAGITLAGVIVLGARAGRFGPNGQPRSIPASSMPLVALGVMFLAFGWIGFNGGSAPLGVQTATIIVNTLNAGAFGAIGVMMLIWALRGVPSADLILNGVLGGLVAITANANVVSIPASCVIGLLGGGAVVIGTRLLERWRLDDAVGAIPVHGFAGVVGVVCTGLFADASWLAETKQMTRAHFTIVQCLGAVVCIAWSFGAGWLLWKIVGRSTSLRIGPDEEAVGMNYSEHKVEEPLQQLTAAVVDSTNGARDAQVLDLVRDGELAPLARAIQSLIRRQAEQRRETGSWAETLGEIHSMITQEQHAGGSASREGHAELVDAREAIGDVGKLLERRRLEDPTAAVLLDLVRMLERRLDTALAALPRIDRSLERVAAGAGRLDDLAVAMRGRA
jgi:ammonium transporter, Amt family